MSNGPEATEVFDLAILGGGCAGLSLSMALAALGERCPRTLVIEPRAAYTNDRTWCCWKDSSAPTPYPTAHRWQTMRVANAGKRVSLDCGATPYQMVAALDFYTAAQALIDGQPNIELRLASSVIGEPTCSGGIWTLHTTTGSVTARAVVDTRPPQMPRRDGATLWQSFYGHEIECNAEVFDPLALDLMDFLPPDARDVAFVYVLPVTPTRALVELTVFGATPLAAQELSVRLDAALALRVGGAGFTTLRSEHGILPMGLTVMPPSAHKSYVRVGVMAGGARPSTGFAFQRIQRWAGECAHAIVRNGLPVGHSPDPFPLRWMDQIFLDVLRAEPQRGGEIFYALLSRADPARVIRFLSGHAGVADSAAVVAAMPFMPFIKAALALMIRQGPIRDGASARPKALR